MAESERAARLRVLTTEILPVAAQLEGRLGSRETRRVKPIMVDIGPSRATPAASALYSLDLELRRAASAVRVRELHAGEGSVLVRPVSSASAGIEITEASAASLHLVVEAYGDVKDALLWTPLQLLITASWLLDRARGLHLHIGSNRRPPTPEPGERRRPLAPERAQTDIDALLALLSHLAEDRPEPRSRLKLRGEVALGGGRVLRFRVDSEEDD